MLQRLTRLLAAATVVFVLLSAAGALAQSRVRTRRVGAWWSEGTPRVSFSAEDMVHADVRRKLESGLPQTIVLRVYAYSNGSGRPRTVHTRACRVVYDLWEEVYRVQVQTPRLDRAHTVRRIDDVVRRCLVFSHVRVGSPEDYNRAQRIYFAAIVEFNPLSPDTVQRIRRWLARPAGRVRGDAFFGSFVSLFVNRRIGDAERTVRFRSQWFEVP